MTAAIFVSPRVDRTLGSVSYLVGGPEQRAWRAGVYQIQRHKDSEAEREDGVFPLLTNDRTLSATEVLRAYKRQPLLEKRFSQFKTDFAVAPVYLKNVSRIQGLLAAYFFVLLVQTLLERELRQAMARAGEASLPLYPEGRPCARPTTHRLIEVFSSIQRHEVRVGDGEPQVMVTQLTTTQRAIVRLLGLDPRTYGLA